MSIINDEVERRLKRISRKKTEVDPPADIYECIQRASPNLEPPRHLDAYIQQLHKAIREGGVEICFSAPPQHGKTVATKHGLVQFAIERQGKRHAYCTYNQHKARTELLDVKRIAFEMGLDPHSRDNTLTMVGDTVIQFVGCTQGELTGNPVDGLLVIDDPIKDQKEAFSRTVREDRWNWFVQVAETRRHPGSSVVAMMTRWHVDDLLARLINNYHYRYIRLAAECDSSDDPNGRQLGEALWPQHRPTEWLDRYKRSPLAWASMYQGLPRALGDTLFKDALFYDENALPAEPYVPLYGADLAYTAKTRADWSVLLAGRWYRQRGELYLTNELRKQVQADVFTGLMKEKWTKEPGRVLWFGSTTEKGVADLIKGTIPKFEYAQATVDKYVRALPTAEQLWNPGKVFVPSFRPWCEDFVNEVLAFTGQNDPTDDRIDALAALGHLCLGISGQGYDNFNKELLGRLKRGEK